MQNRKIAANTIISREKRASIIISILTLVFIIGGLCWIIYSSKIIGKYSIQVDKKKSELEKLKKTIDSLELIKVKLINSISQSSDVGLKAKFASKDSNQSNTDVTGSITILKPSGNYERASKLEQEGFEYLLKKDVLKTIRAFAEADKAYLSFHQVYEIQNYLVKNKDKLVNPESDFWDTAYTEILKSYSWKMPDNVKKDLARLSFNITK